MTAVVSHRRSLFRQGKPIHLADGQMWIFPAPPRGAEWNAAPFGADYQGIIAAIMEAEDEPERLRGELALAIFLLSQNYRLAPNDYQLLLGSTPDSLETTDWQLAFREIAQDHLAAYRDYSLMSSEHRPLADSQRRLSRFLI